MKNCNKYIVKKQFFHIKEKDFYFQYGEKLDDITVAYETFGKLNAEKSNAILVLHALTGDSHAAGFYGETVQKLKKQSDVVSDAEPDEQPEEEQPDKQLDKQLGASSDEKPGWWDVIIGPGKAIDTDIYFVICSNILGGCMGSSGPDSTISGKDDLYGMTFPMITISDMVRVQKRLIDHLGIEKLLSVAGGSLGGMQALEWCVRYPDMVESAMPIATTMKHSALAIAFNEVARQAIISDPNWNHGNYSEENKPDTGLSVARMIGHITYLSDESMRAKFGRKLQDSQDLSFSFDSKFQVESYLKYQGEKFVTRFDANSFLYITKAADHFDLEEQHGDGSSVQAFSNAKARFLIVSYSSDWLYPTYESKAIVNALKKNRLDVSFCEIESKWGHDAFLLKDEVLAKMIKGFLTSVYETIKTGKIKTE